MNPNFQSLGSFGWAFAAVALLLAAAHGCGRLLVPATGQNASRLLELQALRVAVGLNLLGVVGIIFGMLRLLGGGWSVWLLVGLGLPSIVLLCVEWKTGLRAANGLRRSSSRWREGAS